MPAAGDIAIIGYNTDQGGGAAAQSLSFVVLRPLAAGTIIYFTDRAWTGTAFTNAGGDGTFSYTVPGGGLAAGAVITPPITNSSFGTAGDTIYAYLGAADVPTTFLFAIDFADGNSTFNGNLTGTGLVAGVSAAAISLDIGSYHGPTNGGGAEYFMRQISDSQNWAGDDIDGQQAHAHPFDSLFQVAPDFQLWVTGAGGGDGLVKVDGDGTISGGNLGHNINRLYTDFQSGGNDLLYRPADITFDTVHGKFYIADSDLAGHNRILQGSIADLFNPAATPTLTVLFNNTDSAATGRIDHMEVDPQTGSVYFTLGSTFMKVASNTANQAGTQLANFGTGSGNPIGTGNNFFNDMVIDFATGDVYFTSTRVLASAGGDSVQKNYLYRISGLDNADGAGAFTFGGGNITVMPFSPQDNEVGTGTNNTGEAFPKEYGTLDGLAIDTVNHILYFSTGEVLLDDDQNSGTAPVYHPGGIYAYALTGNPTGAYTVVWQQTGGSGPQGILSDLEIDPVTGRWYVLDTTGTSGVVAGDGEGIWSGNLNGTGTPVLFSTINNESGLTGIGLHLNRAPTMTTTANGSLGTTEASNGPGSGTSTAVDFIGALTVSDFENSAQTDQLAGASVWIATNLQPGDRITINGSTSGSSGGISWAYDTATGVMTLTGASTFSAYETLLQTARFTVSGDNPTNYGTATDRVLNWTVNDGILNADAGTATVTVTGINDAPVNSVGAGGSIAEDVGGPLAITGISVSDADADPATQDITVTLTAEAGVLTVLTNVTGGLVAGEVSGNGTATVTLTGTQNQINAVLAATNGLVLSGLSANLNGGIDITVVTNDGGFSGNDPGLTGTGTSEQDSDVRVITVTAVNDAPTVSGDGTETAVQVTEDTNSNSLTQTVSSLFSGQFSDALDNQTANGGSSANSFAGIAVTVNGSGSAGNWQYWNGASWVNIGASSTASATTLTAATPIRFAPAANFNGPAPALTAVLVDNSGGALTNGGHIDVTTRGGTTAYSTNTVVLSQPDITAVNDAPTVINGGTTTLLAVSEDTTNPAGATVNSLFGSHFADAADNVSGGSSPNTFAGIMIGIDNSNGSQGSWQVFTGGVWIDLPALTPTDTYLVAAGDSLRFVPAPNYNGTPGGLVVLLIDDSAGAVVTGTRLDSSLTGSGGSTVYSNATMNLGTSVTAVNDAPAVNADTITAFTEGAGAVAVTPAFTVTDVDNANATSATISISDFVAGDQLVFVTQNGITGVYNSGTGVLTLSGTASVANYQAAIRSITYDNAGDANAGGTDNTRTVNITVTDGVTPSSQTATVINITDGGGDAQDDAFSTTESAPIVAGDLLANNGSGADTGVSDITEVNGNAITYGVQFALPSGALLTIYADGTFDYDPNGQYDSLVDAAAGAGNSTATDSFTYTVDGGDVATVTITINGQTDAGDIYLGTGGGDTITGSGTGNTVNAGGGNDTVNGLGGGDVINGEAGDDTLNGGDQADKLNGGDDNDQLNGEEGNDILMGGAGADDLVGGNGNDTLDGGTGADDMNGGDGSDIYFVDDAGDTITDSSGIDTVKSMGTHILGAGLEHLTLLGSGDSNGTGNASNNTLNGNDGVNILSGMDGADKLYGFGGKDVLNGGAGADVIDGGDSNDVINGGADNDTAVGGSGNDILNGDDGNDQLDGGVGADKLYGGAGIDQLTGGVGNDYMYGGDGVDTMNGNDGNDYLDGGTGPDKMYGGLGNDVYIVNEYNDFISESVGQGYDIVRSSAATYILGDNLEALELAAGAGDIAGTGNSAANAITGNEGVNILDGKAGVDTIKGGDGNDVIFGGLGNDLLYGQNGYDVFAVRQESVGLATLETDRIFDLNIAGGDRVDLSAIDADSTTMGNQAFHFATVLSTFSGAAGEATLTYDAATASTYLRLDVNGDKKADYSLRMDGDHTGTSGNIIAPGTFLDGTGGWIL